MPRIPSSSLMQATANQSAVRADQVGQRISTACTHCRKRRTKCSGGSPCHFCSTRSLECVYDRVAQTPTRKRKVKLSGRIDLSQQVTGDSPVSWPGTSSAETSPSSSMPVTPRQSPGRDSIIHPLMCDAANYPGHSRFLPSVLQGSKWLASAAWTGDVPWVGHVESVHVVSDPAEADDGELVRCLAFVMSNSKEQDTQTMMGSRQSLPLSQPTASDHPHSSDSNVGANFEGQGQQSVGLELVHPEPTLIAPTLNDPISIRSGSLEPYFDEWICFPE